MPKPSTYKKSQHKTRKGSHHDHPAFQCSAVPRCKCQAAGQRWPVISAAQFQRNEKLLNRVEPNVTFTFTRSTRFFNFKYQLYWESRTVEWMFEKLATTRRTCLPMGDTVPVGGRHLCNVGKQAGLQATYEQLLSTTMIAHKWLTKGIMLIYESVEKTNMQKTVSVTCNLWTQQNNKPASSHESVRTCSLRYFCFDWMISQANLVDACQSHSTCTQRSLVEDAVMWFPTFPLQLQTGEFSLKKICEIEID